MSDSFGSFYSGTESINVYVFQGQIRELFKVYSHVNVWPTFWPYKGHENPNFQHS